MLPVPSTSDLAAFSGRPAATYGPFAPQALEQATLMFSIVTGLKAYPDDPDMAKLARYAILELADRLFLEQPFAEMLSRPFQSETIMSYTYSRTTATAVKIQTGIPAGLFWWDLAIDQLGTAANSPLGSGSIAVVTDGLVQTDGGGWAIQNAADDEGGNRPPYVRIS